ncbi:MAG TPA: DUF6600 domain-containing protein [Candidatus Krumholzibacteria bacterium]|nr:DUF6600 domain-containing protein [Candidatus Krumholzibacteria bacterium]
MLRRVTCAIAIGSLFAMSCSAQHRTYDTELEGSYEYDESYGYDDVYSDVGMFAELDVYGDWIHVGTYGWVWRPAVSAAWQPYYHGHWAWTEYGWMWISYEPFGWAAYHYGYWDYHGRTGWIWIPGYEWAPNRVTWYVDGGLVCWAPLTPAGAHIGDPWTAQGPRFWVVVEADNFTSPDVARYRVKPERFKSQRGSQRESMRASNSPPPRRTIEKVTRSRVETVPVTLERRRAAGREFARPTLPAEQQRLVEKNKVRMPAKASKAKKLRGDRRESAKPKQERGKGKGRG